LKGFFGKKQGPSIKIMKADGPVLISLEAVVSEAFPV
jgi:hypothetical protein